MTTSLRLPFDGPLPPDPAARDAAARRASVDPARNVVLEASAGTGKTRVLVDRYVNLLEAGVDPANVLAITFTRKAAAEMRERIVQRLRRDAALSPAHAARWRALRERLGDVNIGTIDAFCLLLLREFPLEADVGPGFSVADETDVVWAAREALDRLLPIARRLASSDPGVALVLAQLDEKRLRSGLASLLNRRLVVRRTFRRALAGVPADLALAVIGRQAAERVRAAFWRADGGLDGFLAGGPRAHPRFALLARDLRALEAASLAEAPPPDPAWLQAALDLVRGYFLTGAGKPRERLAADYPRGEFPSAEAARRHAQAVAQVAPDIAEALNRHRRDVNAMVTRGLARLFRLASRLYVQRLEARSVLDFTELLGRALDLLGRMDEFSQSRYRLESRYHHLLVDEFQDTSSPQWRLVSLLVRSWGEGAGLAHDRPLAPSIFLVGDRKQSIYGFRDADVTILRRARRFVGRLRQDPRVRHAISRSFRAVAALQAFQNDLFAAVEVTAGRRDAFRFGPRDRFPLDEAWREAALPAPAATAEAGRDSPADDALAAIPLGVVAADELTVNADAVAGEIGRLLSTGTVRDRVSGMPRPVRPADIAVLFRSRESHREYARALERRSIPCYVYKGLGFFDADEVKDLMALVRYLADPASEVRAAAFLRSGFVRLSDPALHALAGRLSAALRSEPGDGDSVLQGPADGHQPGAPPAGLDDRDRRVLDAARRVAAGWVRLADDLPPAALLDRILAESAYAWERRGPREAQARENLKKARALVRRIQNRGYATLGRIAEHLEQLSAGDDANAVVDAVDAVNLMTIHSAKGLEFPVVFLVSLARGSGGRRSPIRAAGASGPRQTAPDALVSVGDFLSEADHDLRAREREETKRLLYVAATRARDRLYFSATPVNGQVRPAPGSLAQVLPASFARFVAQARPEPEARVIAWAGDSGTHPFRVLPLAAAGAAGGGAGRNSAPPAAIDAFGPLAAAREPERVTVTGSAEPLASPAADDLAEAASKPGGPAPWHGEDREPAEERRLGILVHRLLAWRAAGRADPDQARRQRRGRTLASQLEGCDDPDLIDRAEAICQELWARPEVGRLLADAELLFELPFSFVEAGRVVRGTIDCVAREAAGGVTVLEFKTGAPRTEHEAQLSTYLRAAAELFPGARPRGLLVYSTR